MQWTKLHSPWRWGPTRRVLTSDHHHSVWMLPVKKSRHHISLFRFTLNKEGNYTTLM